MSYLGSGQGTYQDAINILNTRRRVARPKQDPSITLHESSPSQEIPTTHGALNLKGTPSIVGMREWLGLLGYSDSTLSSLNAIHIAGTKGKGSTCAFTESLLRAHSERTRRPLKTGLYTSPHLRYIEERIRIDAIPLDPDEFAKDFFAVYDHLSTSIIGTSAPTSSDPSISSSPSVPFPRYLQLLLLTAIQTFVREKVDVAIFETHHGGEFDATNILDSPVVTAVTTLGMDHVAQLGPTLENIAWHKAGVFKPGVPAFTSVTSRYSVEGKALAKRAREKVTSVRFVKATRDFPEGITTLQARVQRVNASLAVEVAKEWISQKRQGDKLTRKDIERGVRGFDWPGRFQIVPDITNVTWFLDSAHNELSMGEAAEWFGSNSRSVENGREKIERVLIFAHVSRNRDGEDLLRALARALKKEALGVIRLILTSYDSQRGRKGMTEQNLDEIPLEELFETYKEAWRDEGTDGKVLVEPMIDKALEIAKIGEMQKHVLITGSQHLVGGALEYLDPYED